MMDKKKSYHDLAQRIKQIGKKNHYVRSNTLGVLPYGLEEYPFLVCYISQGEKPFQQLKTNICLSAGIHGDEPAGVETLLSLMESGDFFTPYLASFDFMIFPCMNPSGYEYHQRESLAGIDLNRQFRTSSPPLEVSFVKNLTKPLPFTLHMDFHEDIDSEGFYLYEAVQEGKKGCGEKIIESIVTRYPVNLGDQIEGMSALKGVIGRDAQNRTINFMEMMDSRPDWPLAFYFFSKGTPYTITCETPVHLGISQRVDIHSIALSTTLNHILKH